MLKIPLKSWKSVISVTGFRFVEGIFSRDYQGATRKEKQKQFPGFSDGTRLFKSIRNSSPVKKKKNLFFSYLQKSCEFQTLDSLGC